jgi:hypothetical protein
LPDPIVNQVEFGMSTDGLVPMIVAFAAPSLKLLDIVVA